METDLYGSFSCGLFKDGLNGDAKPCSRPLFRMELH